MARCLNLPALALAVLPALLCGSAMAELLRDPTRPPGSTEYAPGQTDGGLQSIVRREGQKPRALINGEWVSLGGKIGGAEGTQRLIAIHADSVVLLDAQGNRETLQLTPAASKTFAKPNSPASRTP